MGATMKKTDLYKNLGLKIDGQMKNARTPDRFEAQPLEFFRRVVSGYAARAEAQPERFARIRADQTRDQVWQELTATFFHRGWLSGKRAANNGPA